MKKLAIAAAGGAVLGLVVTTQVAANLIALLNEFPAFAVDVAPVAVCFTATIPTIPVAIE